MKEQGKSIWKRKMKAEAFVDQVGDLFARVVDECRLGGSYPVLVEE